MEARKTAINTSGGNHSGQIVGENYGSIYNNKYYLGSTFPEDGKAAEASASGFTPRTVDTIREHFPEDVPLYGRYDVMMSLRSAWRRAGPPARVVLIGSTGVG